MNTLFYIPPKTHLSLPYPPPPPLLVDYPVCRGKQSQILRLVSNALFGSSEIERRGKKINLITLNSLFGHQPRGKKRKEKNGNKEKEIIFLKLFVFSPKHFSLN